MAPLLSWVAWFASSLGLWLVLSGSIARSELIAGAGVAAIAATVAVAVGLRRRRASLRPRDLGELASGFAPVPRDLLRLVVVLVRELARSRPPGAFTAVPLDARGDDGRALARRTVVPTARSVSPGSYVVDVDEAGGTMLVHELEPRERA